MDVSLKQPSFRELAKAERDFEEKVDDDFIGSPEYSVKVVLSSGLSHIIGNGIQQIDPYLNEMEIVAGFRGKKVDDFKDLIDENTNDIESIDNELSSNELQPPQDRMAEICDSLNMPYHIYRMGAEIDGLNEVVNDGVYIEEGFHNSDDFSVESVSMKGVAEKDSVQEAYQSLQEDLALSLFFRYDGGQEERLYGHVDLDGRDHEVEIYNSSANTESVARNEIREIYDRWTDGRIKLDWRKSQQGT